jgi:hypothetical protein
MNFQDWDLGYQDSGRAVVVRLSGDAANVRLLDEVNFSHYRNGRSHRAIGGYYTQSPIRLVVPSAGHWHLVIDFGGHAGRTNASVSVI